MGGPVQGKRTLIVVAAPAEAAAVCREFGAAEVGEPWKLVELGRGFDLVMSGVGKANAAGATARFLDPARHGRVVSAGIAGALPSLQADGRWAAGLEIGAVAAAAECAYSDEGIETPDGFLDCGQMGFPLGDFPGRGVPVDAGVLVWLRGVAGRVGTIATVSTCSGTDDLARRVVERTGAIAEAMEGAAVVQVARRLGVAAGEVRVISNTTGDRGRQVWRIREAFEVLGSVFGRLAGGV